MDRIRIRPKAKTVRTLDRGDALRHSIRENALRLRKAEPQQQDEQETPTEYAENEISHAAQDALQEAKQELEDGGRRIRERVQNRHYRNQGSVSRRKEAEPFSPEERDTRQTCTSFIRTRTSEARQVPIRTAGNTGRHLKTAERTGRMAIRTRNTGLRTVGKTMEKTVQTTVRAAPKAAAAAKKAAVTVGKAIGRAVQGIVEGVQSLASAMAAGGWVVVLIVVVLCMVALLVGSGMGLFFSDDVSEKPMRTVIREINTEYQNTLDAVKTAQPYDELILTGSSANWREVLAVYSVLTNMEETTDRIALDSYKLQLLEDTFWAMNPISCRTETETETKLLRTMDEEGVIHEEEAEVTKTILYLEVSHRTADEMADYYLMDDVQRQQMTELLGPAYEPFWRELLYGLTSGAAGLAEVAKSQVGNVGGGRYWSWYGYTGRVDWCCIFVSWCADQCGLLDSGAVLRFASVGRGVTYYKDKDLWQPGTVTPEHGWLIFYDWDDPDHGQNGLADHVGIVEKVESGMIYTIEGNVRDECRRCRYPLGHYEILGFGVVE